METTEYVEPTDFRGVLRGEGFRGKKSWERGDTAYENLAACERGLSRLMRFQIETYRVMGFTVIRDDEDGPSKFIRSGLPGSRRCPFQACVIAGASGRANRDGRYRAADHRFYCLLDKINPRQPSR